MILTVFNSNINLSNLQIKMVWYKFLFYIWQEIPLPSFTISISNCGCVNTILRNTQTLSSTNINITIPINIVNEPSNLCVYIKVNGSYTLTIGQVILSYA